MSVSSVEAHELVRVAMERARAMDLHLSVAVVDEGGYLQAFARMDGAPLFSVQVAQGKAYGVVYMGRPSAAIKEVADTRPSFFAAIKDTGLHPLIPSPGGVALPGGGAIGVSGAADPQQDVHVAEAAIQAVLSPNTIG